MSKEKKKVKIVNKKRPSQGNFTTNSSTEYVRGGRTKADGSKEKARSVEIGKDYQGDYTKTVRKTKKDGSVKTKSKKISDKKAERIKKRKDKTFTPINYGTMNNAINTQFKMTPGSKEVDSGGTFKNDAAVLNMGSPSNYGTPDSAPLNRLDPDENKKVMDYRQGKGRVKVTTSRNSRGAGKLASGTGETNQKITGYGETNTKVRGSRGSRVATDGRGNNARVVKEGVLKSHIKSKGVQLGNIRKADSKK